MRGVRERVASASGVRVRLPVQRHSVPVVEHNRTAHGLVPVQGQTQRKKNQKIMSNNGGLRVAGVRTTAGSQTARQRQTTQAAAG